MSGNIDDCFRLGIGLAKKSLKLYTAFDESDILLCSPLGLRMIIGEPTETHHERDFLASIEVLIVDKVRRPYSVDFLLGTPNAHAKLGASRAYLRECEWNPIANRRRHFARSAVVVEELRKALPADVGVLWDKLHRVAFVVQWLLHELRWGYYSLGDSV